MSKQLETGRAILKVDDSGNKYWSVYNVTDKESLSLEVGANISISPEAFKEVATILILEDTE